MLSCRIKKKSKTKEIQTELHAYNYDNLDDVQKRTYDALDDYLSRELALEDYFYYSNSMIGSYSSTIQDLPLLLQMYAFNDVDDIENLYKDIEHSKEKLSIFRRDAFFWPLHLPPKAYYNRTTSNNQHLSDKLQK